QVGSFLPIDGVLQLREHERAEEEELAFVLKTPQIDLPLPVPGAALAVHLRVDLLHLDGGPNAWVLHKKGALTLTGLPDRIQALLGTPVNALLRADPDGVQI